MTLTLSVLSIVEWTVVGAVSFGLFGLFLALFYRLKPPGLVVLKQENALLTAENDALKMTISDLNVIKGESQQLSEQVRHWQQVHSDQVQQYQQLQSDFVQSKADVASLTTRLASEQESYEAKLALLENAKAALTQEFKVLSTEILEQKQAQLQTQGKEMLGGLLQPVQSSLEQFKQRIETVHKEDVEGRASLKTELEQLKQLNQTMSQEAHNLTKALKGDAKLQGNWGELILKKLLESSGLREGIEFESERSFTQEDGQRLRPDVIVHLPENKQVIIDSKVSLLDYEQALNAEDDAVRQQAVKAHLVSLTKHIKALSDKRYDHLEGLNAPDFVLMFIPIEGAYMMAIEQNPSIFENAFDQKVAVVTPTTLFTTLKTIEQLWRYERQSEHTVKLIKRAAEVHDKFAGFVESFEKVGKQLGTAQNTYEQARKQMMSGAGNLVRQAEMLKELAGKTKKEIPSHLLEEAEGERLLNKEDSAS